MFDLKIKVSPIKKKKILNGETQKGMGIFIWFQFL